MPDIYLLDANAISHIMRNTEGAVASRYRQRLLAPAPCQMVTSILVQCELPFGLARKPNPRLQAAYDIQMRQLPVLPLDTDVAEHYAGLRTVLERDGTPMGANELLIAAHALSLGLTLVTNNERDFADISGLKIENWTL